ncbi:uncharacterized protein [Nicotiana sylvestris]|uniref:uncharacterized protein n=1 Tax=Nicotiana sylvestris TaxID=4096 RepID=UPI00388C7F2F
MTSLTLLLRHSGKWNSESNYVDYSIEGILIKEVEKENREFGMYPLCITMIEKELVSGGSLIQGDIVQIDESVQRRSHWGVRTGQEFDNFKSYQREVMAGQVYKDKATLKEVMEHYAISQKIQFRVDRSNSVRFKTSSINKSELFKVREFIDKHTCLLKDKVYEQRHASSSLISSMIRPKLTNHKRKYTPKDIIDYVKSDLGVDGFDHCRPIVVVDGSHLKSYYTGAFVSASMLDGTRHILPLAYGVIDSENDVAWTWFFEQFKITYGDGENMCIISDRYESIIKSVSRVLMEKVEKVDIRVKEYLELAEYEKWARLYAPVNRGWTMTSNIAESINAALVSARELPIYDFLEEVRKMFGR